ncbi:hypothetical protein ABIB56_002803 [Glaciihabitans sp. UYNi722]
MGAAVRPVRQRIELGYGVLHILVRLGVVLLGRPTAMSPDVAALRRLGDLYRGAVLGYTIGGTLARTPLSTGSALPCLSFLLLGGVARTVRPHIRTAAPVGFGLLLIAAVSVASGICAPLDIKKGDFGTPVISIVVAGVISFGLLLVAESVFNRLGARGKPRRNAIVLRRIHGYSLPPAGLLADAHIRTARAVVAPVHRLRGNPVGSGTRTCC